MNYSLTYEQGIACPTVVDTKKFQYKVILLAFGAGLLFCLLDAIIDSTFFYKQSFTDVAFANIPAQELYVRTSYVICFLIFGIIVSRYLGKIKRTEQVLKNVLNNVIPISVTNEDYEIIMANDSYEDIFGKSSNPRGRKKCYESRPGASCKTDKCPLTKVMDGADLYSCETTKFEGLGKKRTFIVTATPFFNSRGERVGICETFQDISERRQLEEEKEKLINQLQEALQKVKMLSGLLPICSSCKKIRDDNGYWNQIDHYIRTHSEAQFSHGICPDCAQRLYPQFYSLRN